MKRLSEETKILICAYAYWPSLGGLELTAEKLASWLSQQGHDVTVLTFTPLGKCAERPGLTYKIVRKPGVIKQIITIFSADVVLTKHLSLRCCWPIIFFRNPLLIWHATWYPEYKNRAAKWIRQALMRHGINVANSHAISEHLERCEAVVHPGYSESVYQNRESWGARAGFVYLGRLAHEKGCDLILRALAQLPGESLRIIGDGRELADLKALVRDLGLSDRVHFLGQLEPDRCADQLNQVRVLVAPSRYAEPFGTIALEGLAAGCRVVVSDGGGLPEAAGPTGFVFPSGNVNALAEAMRHAVSNPLTPEECAARDNHLSTNSFGAIAPRLLSLLP